MSRRRRAAWASVGLGLAVAAAALAVPAYLAKCDPDFYIAAACPADYDTREKASRLLTRLQDLKSDIRTATEWGETFTAAELNCFFAEMLSDTGTLHGLLPPGAHSPRVAIEGDRLKVGVRYGRGFWSTVVWVELRLWLVADETNLMAAEVCDLRAGRLPVGTQSVLEAIAEVARQSHVDVTWYRHQGRPVGLFRFFPDQPRPVSQVLTVEVGNGAIVVAGRTEAASPAP